MSYPLSKLPPAQHAVGQPCAECARPLSRYNPYTVCGPCRVRLAASVDDDADIAAAVELVGWAWERFPRREVVRRGALLEETRATDNGYRGPVN